MPRRNSAMFDKLLDAAQSIVQKQGPDKLTFDAVAERVGVTKQAVIYWFPNKARLVEALVRPSLEAEAIIGRNALKKAQTAEESIRCFLEALAVFHMADLERYKLMYVTPQIGQRPGRKGAMLTTLGRIHPSTTEMYDELATCLVRAGRYSRMVDARRAAVTIHTALLGLLLRMAMSDTLNAPLKYRDDVLVEALLDVIAPEAA